MLHESVTLLLEVDQIDGDDLDPSLVSQLLDVSEHLSIELLVERIT